MPLKTLPFDSLKEAQYEDFHYKDGGLHLFNNFACPFGHRALWSAVEVDADFEMIEVSLGDMPAAYIEKFNRYGTVPYLLSNGYSVYESSIIAQYLDSKHGGKIFLRDHPDEAALAQLVGAKFEASPFYQLLRQFNDENVANLKEMLTEIEQIYREHAAEYRSKGPYLLGDRFSSAELLTVPFYFRFELLLKHFYNFEWVHEFPLIHAAYTAAKSRAAFQETIREPEVYIHHFAKFVPKA